MWIQYIFRIIGLFALGGGFYAFYDFGKELLPLFEQFLKHANDPFDTFVILSSFFIGALALIWTGIRFVALRSFSSAWLYYAILPLTAWMQGIYDIGLIGTMDRVLSLGLVYLGIYSILLVVVRFAQRRWYTPVSHESLRHVSLEKAETSLFFELRWIILCIGLITLLILHPAPIGETLDMVISSIVYAFNLLR